MFVFGVLIVAPAATLKVRTSRLNAIRRRIQYRFQTGSCETRLLLGQCSFHLFAFENKGDEDRFAWAVFVRGKPGEALPAID
jgi:hypothetical protein